MDDFLLELFFAEHEFTAKYLLGSSDAESFTMHEILSYADEETKRLWESCSLGYTESRGHPLLRKEIVQQFYDPLLISSENNVLCLAGAEEGTFCKPLIITR